MKNQEQKRIWGAQWRANHAAAQARRSQRILLRLMSSIDRSETAEIAEIIRLAGASRGTFRTNFNNSPEFKKKFLEKKQEILAKQLAEV